MDQPVDVSGNRKRLFLFELSAGNLDCDWKSFPVLGILV